MEVTDGEHNFEMTYAGPKGEILTVSRGGQAQSPVPGDKRFLLDLSSIESVLKDSATEYRLSLVLGGQDEIMTTARLLASSDLFDWSLLKDDFPLIRLYSDGRSLDSDLALLSPEKVERYILVEVKGLDVGLEKAGLEVYTAHHSSAAPQKQPLAQASFSGIQDPTLKNVIYDTSGHFPASVVNIDLAGPFLG
ncbi:MAG: DUF3999 domain-containing protein [Deltaproteobacteria bacterium]|nr:DUF3999 domain-containing protein [Deltaproteobacteria bacterium]